ncbi:MAG: DUF1611 domain-containing protein [Acidobacteriota bacterium]
MSTPRDGNAVIYCDRAFGSTIGKTAHGLVRRTSRYKVTAVIDSELAGQDAGQVLDGRPAGVPIVPGLEEALAISNAAGFPATHLVIGLAPDGGRLPEPARVVVADALRRGLSVDSGLHDFLGDDPELAALARKYGGVIRDIRKPPPRESLHFFSGRIDEVNALRVAILGTDSAVGKRTTAWMLVDALRQEGLKTELVGTGQTAWLQGARYCLILDSLVNDFVAGEIEHAVWSAWREGGAQAIVIEGQGSLLNPAYPGGFEILAAGRPDMVVLQHAPMRRHYDGFPGVPIHDLATQIRAVELIGSRPVVAITINHEGIAPPDRPGVCERLAAEAKLPVFDVLDHGAGELARAILSRGRYRTGSRQ